MNKILLFFAIYSFCFCVQSVNDSNLFVDEIRACDEVRYSEVIINDRGGTYSYVFDYLEDRISGRIVMLSTSLGGEKIDEHIDGVANIIERVLNINKNDPMFADNSEYFDNITLAKLESVFNKYLSRLWLSHAAKKKMKNMLSKDFDIEENRSGAKIKLLRVRR